MISLTEFTDYVKRGVIPPDEPRLVDWMQGNYAENYTARSVCANAGMWAIVDMQWTAKLAAWIAGRSVLEIMAGKGWLAKALSLHGANVIATDNMGWSNMHADGSYLYPVEKLTAVRAVRKYNDAEILLVSWPPYDDLAVCRACAAWGKHRPVIYIGEGDGGCNAPGKFFEHFRVEESVNIPLPQWDGIHDYVSVGYYH